MDVEFKYRPTHSLAVVHIAQGDSVVAESGALIAMDANVDMQTQAGGFAKGLKRLLGGESFFRNTFTAARGAGEVLLAPSMCGDMMVLDVGGADRPGWFLQSSCYVASEPGVDVDAKLGGFRGFFSGAGLIVLRTSGRGQMIVGSFGALAPLEVDGELVIDTGHLVAWEDRPDLTHTVTKAAGSWWASLKSGEGLACHFRGRGKVWMQTRNASSYGSVLGPRLPAV